MPTNTGWNPKPVIRWWETSRIIYNVVLLAEGFLLAPIMLANLGAYSFGILGFGFLANVCYSLGPLIELYLNAYGVTIGRWRHILFVVGLLFSILVIFSFASLSFFLMDD